MSYNTDGNLAALDAYLRQEDEYERERMEMVIAQEELAADLFDAYVSKNYDVIDEVNDALLDTDTTDNLINKLREAMTKECQRPVMGRGGEIYDAYMKIISEACEDIAKRCTTPDQFDKFRGEYGL